MKTTLTALAVTIALASPALAGQCPALMGEIDAAMATTTADDATKAEVMELYASGQAKHDAGDHAGSVADLNAAKELLGL